MTTRAFYQPVVAEPPAPIDMVLHCPACGMQHIDAPEKPKGTFYPGFTADESHAENLRLHGAAANGWSNPPHRSHLCHGCGHIWRPADVPTNGVAAVKTRGEADSPTATPPQQAVQGVREALQAAVECLQWHYENPNETDMLGFRQKQDAKACRKLRAALASSEVAAVPVVMPEPLWRTEPNSEGTMRCTCNSRPHSPLCGNVYGPDDMRTYGDQRYAQGRAEAAQTEYCWLVENGKQPGQGLAYRTMKQGWIEWTEDPYEAIRFSRRADAEMFAEEDEDAWRIVEHGFERLSTNPKDGS